VRSPLLHHYNLGTLKSSYRRETLCPHYSKSCTTSENLKAQVRVHIRNEPFICTLCSKSSSLLASLNSCLVCKKSFHWSSVLRKHSKINSEIKSYSCSRCSNYFISLHILKCSLKEHVYCIFPAKMPRYSPPPPTPSFRPVYALIGLSIYRKLSAQAIKGWCRIQIPMTFDRKDRYSRGMGRIR
jgi:hypothetical protein